MTINYQPMQPVELSKGGVARFKTNSIVEYLLDEGGIDMNALARIDFPREDRDQFLQLIGYSVSGAPLGDNELHEAAQIAFDQGKPEHQARIEVLEARLSDFKAGIRGAVSDLFNVHEDDLS